MLGIDVVIKDKAIDGIMNPIFRVDVQNNGQMRSKKFSLTPILILTHGVWLEPNAWGTIPLLTHCNLIFNMKILVKVK